MATQLMPPPQRKRPDTRGKWTVVALVAVLCALLAIVFMPDFQGKKVIIPKMSQKLDGPIASGEPEVLSFRPVTSETAVKLNAEIPVSLEPNPAASAFRFNIEGTNALDRLNAVDCLTAAIYYEGASETEHGQRAIAQVVLNRVRHPAYPKSVCGVVFQGADRATGCQFTFTCDGALARTPSAGGWQRAQRYAQQALAGYVERPVGWATHYHTIWVVPYWSGNLAKIGTFGAHIFYRWQGGWGRPQSFGGRYAGTEIQPVKLAAALGDLLLANGLSQPVENLEIPDVTVGLAEGPKLSLPPSPLPSQAPLTADTSLRPALKADENRGELIRQSQPLGGAPGK